MNFLLDIKNKLFKDAEISKYNEDTDLYLDIDWEDIAMGGDSEDNNCLYRAMKRQGIYGTLTPSLLILEDGTELLPHELSWHWEAYNQSTKVKPMRIKYTKL